MQEVGTLLAARYPQVKLHNLSNTDNDTVTDTVSSKKNLKHSKTVTVSVKEVHHIAHVLMDKLNSPENFAMYCGYAWHIPQSRLWLYLEMVQKAQADGKCRNPAALFTSLCKRDEVYTG